jgi:hypothetical protein
MTGKELVFDRPRTVAVNRARLEHLVTLEPGLDLWHKSVLDVCTGVGLLTHFWEERDCTITATDGRPENIMENLRRHPWRRGSVHFVNLLKRGEHRKLGQFDIVFAYGILYLLPADQLPAVIAELADCTKELFLASMIVQSHDVGTIQVRKDNPDIPDSSLDGRRCLVARDWFLAELRKHFEFAYITRTQPDDRVFPTQWTTRLRNPRCVFVASRHELDPRLFSEELLSEQTKIKRSRDYEE